MSKILEAGFMPEAKRELFTARERLLTAGAAVFARSPQSILPVSDPIDRWLKSG